MASGHIINLSDLRSVRRVQTLLFTLLPVADAAEADAVHLIAFGVFHLPANAMQATTTPSAASMPTVSVQLLRKYFAQLSIPTCRHGGGEHVVLAATAVCMCLQRRGSATFSTSSLLRMKKGPNHRYIGRCPIQRVIPAISGPRRANTFHRRYSGPRYIGPPTVTRKRSLS